MESFDSTKESLYELLKKVKLGKIQLPDFQRGWVWDDNRIKGIIASIAKSFPIGAVMLLETGNDNVKFKTKPVEGVKLTNPVKPDLLILDGQQRITSLYQSIITNEVVSTKNEKGYELKRWYYIDMKKALDDNLDLEEAIISLNEKKQITANIGRDIILDLSQEEFEFQNMMYPVHMIDEYSVWRKKFNKYWNHNSEKSEFWDEFEEKVILSFNNYMLPVIIMKKENPKEAVCQVFEKVNTGGVSLTVFELLTATFAAEEFDLKNDWENILSIFKSDRAPKKLLSKTSNTDIIQAITLLSTYFKRIEKENNNPNNDELPAVSAKRKEMLNLSLSDYKNYRDKIIDGFIKGAKLLQTNHIYTANDIPYTTQLIPLAAIIAVLGDDFDSAGNKKILEQWYWCGVFGELYGSANETRYANDLLQVVDYIYNGGDLPKSIYDANFAPSRLHTLKTRNSAAYKGIYALLLSEGVKDWITNSKIDFTTYFSEAIDIHHIFPVAYCEKNRIPAKEYDCIINKTPLCARTNKIVRGDAPSEYLPRVRDFARINDSDLESILKLHLINPIHLYSDDFKSFIEYRKEMILQKIEQAMDKPIQRELANYDEGVYIEEESEIID